MLANEKKKRVQGSNFIARFSIRNIQQEKKRNPNANHIVY